jgi:hypothetical protein
MKRRSLIFAVAGFVALTMAAPSYGATSKLAFTGTSIFDHEISPAEEWEDGNVYHLRNMVWVYEVVTSDPRVTGWDTVVINFDLALDAWEGTLWGKDRLEPTAYPDGWYDCTWQGTWNPDEPWAWAGKVVCHGGGTLRGWQLRYEMGSVPEIAGYAFLPGN